MKLTAEHIYAYMPYGLEIKWNDNDEVYTIYTEVVTDYHYKRYPLSTILYSIDCPDIEDLGFKLLLKPLSGLTTEDLKVLGYVDKPNIHTVIQQHCIEGIIPKVDFDYLVSRDYDVFGLIDNGLAEVKE